MTNKTANCKPIIWIRSTQKDILKFPSDVIEIFASDLRKIEKGIDPFSTVKALKGKDLSGALELKKRFDGNTYRVIYIAKLKGCIYILHCFQKKSSSGIKTSMQDLNKIKERLKIAKEDSRKKDKKNGK